MDLMNLEMSWDRERGVRTYAQSNDNRRRAQWGHACTVHATSKHDSILVIITTFVQDTRRVLLIHSD